MPLIEPPYSRTQVDIWTDVSGHMDRRDAPYAGIFHQKYTGQSHAIPKIIVILHRISV